MFCSGLVAVPPPATLTALRTAFSTNNSALASGDFTLIESSYWHLLRGHPRDDTVLSFDIDSLVMHAAAAYGVKECRWPPSCKVFKPVHGRLNNSRIVPVWESWQQKLDYFLAKKVSPRSAHRARTLFDSFTPSR